MKLHLDNTIGLYSLMKREIVRFMVVAHQTIFPPLISSTLYLFVFGLSVGSTIQLPGNMDYITYITPGIVTMYLITGSFENTSSSLFISRWHNHIQEILLSPLSYAEMVLGLLTGGVVRAFIVAAGVYVIASFLSPPGLAHPWLVLYFFFTISVIFASGGLMAALWAKDFGMLSIWATYVILPAVFLGGVFTPVEMLPESIRFVCWVNPFFYLVSGMRYAILGIADAPVWISVAVASVGAVFMFTFTIHLFRIGYRLRT